MKKKIISGLLVVSCLGALGFAAVSEAVGSMENNRTNSSEMRNRWHQRTRYNEETDLDNKNDSDELKKEEAKEIEKNWEKENNHSYNRRENKEWNDMAGLRQRHHSRMNNSCW